MAGPSAGPATVCTRSGPAGINRSSHRARVPTTPPTASRPASAPTGRRSLARSRWKAASPRVKWRPLAEPQPQTAGAHRRKRPDDRGGASPGRWTNGASGGVRCRSVGRRNRGGGSRWAHASIPSARRQYTRYRGAQDWWRSGYGSRESFAGHVGFSLNRRKTIVSRDRLHQDTIESSNAGVTSGASAARSYSGRGRAANRRGCGRVPRQRLGRPPRAPATRPYERRD